LKADTRFLKQPKEFWANVRTISQAVGYTARGKGSTGEILIPTVEAVAAKFKLLNLSISHLQGTDGQLTAFGSLLWSYFEYRANIINGGVRSSLMNRDEAKAEFEHLHQELVPKCPIPMNKQKGEKKGPAFLTGIVNILLEANLGDAPCNYDPKGLTTVTHEAMPLRTLSRRVDGAFPSIVNPIAIWEIKEYYYTTTFGSRVADGVYETLLDGMELEELEEVSARKIYHVLFVDDHFTWWVKGRSYLCRLIDMLHMGYVDEVIVGREVLTRIPEIAQEWKKQFDELARSTREPIISSDVSVTEQDGE
jgi:hypothetical protein